MFGARALPNQSDVAEATAGIQASFLFVHAGVDIVLSTHFPMRAQFFFQIVVHLVLAECCCNAAEP
jgi:hypothetical protein